MILLSGPGDRVLPAAAPPNPARRKSNRMSSQPWPHGLRLAVLRARSKAATRTSSPFSSARLTLLNAGHWPCKGVPGQTDHGADLPDASRRQRAASWSQTRFACGRARHAADLLFLPGAYVVGVGATGDGAYRLDWQAGTPLPAQRRRRAKRRLLRLTPLERRVCPLRQTCKGRSTTTAGRSARATPSNAGDLPCNHPWAISSTSASTARQVGLALPATRKMAASSPHTTWVLCPGITRSRFRRRGSRLILCVERRIRRPAQSRPGRGAQRSH